MKWCAVCFMVIFIIITAVWGGNNGIGCLNEFLEINKLDKKRVKKPKFIHIQRDDPNNGLRYGRASIEVKYDDKVCLITLILTIINIILPLLLSSVIIICACIIDYIVWWVIGFEIGYFCMIGFIAGYYKLKLNKQNKQNKK